MNSLRVHFVVASASLSVAVAGSAIYMLLAGEYGALRFAGWTIMLVTVVYPSLLIAMRSGHDRCSIWLRRLATAGR
jgi:hypothetical protein